ncbi:MAG: NAD(P)/FAD-dependent oxidoreductase [Myxococcota bacterium]
MAATEDVDVIIIGGGPAGLSAALIAGRARRRVVVIDRGSPRHAVSAGVHNFLTQDGTPPAELRRIAWAQMAAYPNVTQHRATVTGLRREDERWIADCGEAVTVRGRAVLLAMGVQDALPDWPGFSEKWGASVHLCPYCHGWELQDQPLATTGHGEDIAHFGPTLHQWSKDIVVIAGDEPLSPETVATLERLEIRIHPAAVVALEGPGQTLTALRLSDGSRLGRTGLFIKTHQRQVPLVRDLGLEMSPLPHNADGLVVVDSYQRTSAPMMWAAGDLTTPFHQVLHAAAAGSTAGAMINAALSGVL